MVGKLRSLAIIILCLPLFGAWPNTGQKYPSVVAAYVGPGDVVSGAIGWWGLRAYSNTLANAGASTTPVIDVLGAITSTGCTIYLLGNGTGGLDLSTSGPGGVGHQCASGAATFCTVTNTSCTISKFYDQSGNAAPLLQASAPNQPTLNLAGLSGLPIATFVGASHQALFTAGSVTSSAQPVTYAAVAFAATSIHNQSIILYTAAGGQTALQFNFGGVAGATGIYFGSVVSASAANGNWYALAGVGAGASSMVYINGVGTSGSAGTQAFGGTAGLGAISDGSQALTGNFTEGGLWPSGFSSGQASSMSSNERSYWSF